MDSSNTIAAGGGATHSGSAAPGSASASSTASSSASSFIFGDWDPDAETRHLLGEYEARLETESDPAKREALKKLILNTKLYLASASPSKTDLYYDQCVLNWTGDDDAECPRGQRSSEDAEFLEDLHSNDDLGEWRATFEDQFPVGELPEGRLTMPEVLEVLRRLRERFPNKGK